MARVWKNIGKFPSVEIFKEMDPYRKRRTFDSGKCTASNAIITDVAVLDNVETGARCSFAC